MELTIVSATIAIAIAVGCAWWCRRLAMQKGRNVLLWMLLGLVLTIVAVPVLAIMPAVPRRGDTRSSDRSTDDGRG